MGDKIVDSQVAARYRHRVREGVDIRTWDRGSTMHITIDRPVVASPSRRAPVTPHHRSAIERLLWGPMAEYCDDCGVEVHAASAIRFSAERVYCSLAHAIEDQDI
jgi:hypothetical protein